MATDSIYILNAGGADAERERLDIQHTLFTDIVDKQLLPPHIAAELASLPPSRPPRVCELATGSAAWLRDLAKVLPASAELVGIDSDTSKFPPSSSSSSSADKDAAAAALPQNVRLLQGDMFQPFGQELQGRFDVVHMRLVVCAARQGTGPRLAEAAASLLRPGGWLVWVDSNELLTTVNPPSPANARFKSLSWAFAVAVGRELDIPMAIPSFLRKAGYTDVESRTHPSGTLFYSEDEAENRRHLAKSRQLLKRLVGQGLAGMVERGGTEGLRTEADAAALMRDLEADLAAAEPGAHGSGGLGGLGARVNIIVVRTWGRKPLAPA